MEVALSDVRASAGMIGHLGSPQNVEIRARVEGFLYKMSLLKAARFRRVMAFSIWIVSLTLKN